MTKQQTLIIMDLQDYERNWETDLEGAKDFYINIGWEDEFETDALYDEFIGKIQKADFDWLNEQLIICDWILLKDENELNNWI